MSVLDGEAWRSAAACNHRVSMSASVDRCFTLGALVRCGIGEYGDRPVPIDAALVTAFRAVKRRLVDRRLRVGGRHLSMFAPDMVNLVVVRFGMTTRCWLQGSARNWRLPIVKASTSRGS